MSDPDDKSSEVTYGSWVRPRPDDTNLSGAKPRGGDLSDSSPSLPSDPPSDQTIVSKGPLLATENAYAGLRPRDLGQALLGSQIGEMRLDKFIGGGGMGAVFRATDQALERTVAVKVLAINEQSDADTQKRFEVEGRSAARLDHPNIARVYNVGQDRGLRYIVFEYIAGANVRDLVTTNGVLPVADAVSFALQITDSLAHAGERGVVHRDIKPSNILVTRSGQAKLVDMGLARMQTVEQAEGELTTSGTTLGTFDYLAPEQARDPRNADTRSDIYSLGCTLYYMLTGRPPFPGGTAIQKLLQHQGDEPENLERFRNDSPRALSMVLSKMLAKKPADRYQTPQDLAAALIVVARQIGLTPALPSPVPTQLTPSTPREWNPALLWLAPVAALVALSLFLPSLWLTGQPRDRFEQLQTAPPAKTDSIKDDLGRLPSGD